MEKQKIYISSIHILKEVNNKMKKGLIATSFVILTIFCTIFLSGCGSSQGGTSPTDYHTGNQGIVFSFMQNSPPTEVFNGDRVPFVVEIKNQGAHPTTPMFWLTGYDRSIIRFSPHHWEGATSSKRQLEARDENNPIGGYDTLEANSVSIVLPEEVDSYNTNMKLTACYPYVTHASAQVCVDPDPTQNQDDACTTGVVSLGSGQGGPVAVTHIEQAASQGKVRFTITVSNVGDGTVIEQGAVGTCTNLKQSQIDVVDVKWGTVAGKGFTECKPNPIRLVNGRGVVYCEASLGGLPNTAFTSLVSIEISYGYKSSISRSISIKRI